MPRLLPFLRRRAGALLAFGLLALLAAPSLAAARASAAKGFAVVVCTTEGLVTVPLGQDGVPTKVAEHEHCAACLGRDLALAAPPPPALRAPADAERTGAQLDGSRVPVHSPYLRPEARAPPALA